MQLEQRLYAQNIDGWIRSQDGEVSIRVLSEKDLKVQDAYNPFFDVSKLPVNKQAEARIQVDAAVEANKVMEMSVVTKSVA